MNSISFFSSFTWVVASQTCSTTKHLPEEGRVILSVLPKHFLQCLRPVQLIQHNGGYKSTKIHTYTNTCMSKDNRQWCPEALFTKIMAYHCNLILSVLLVFFFFFLCCSAKHLCMYVCLCVCMSA